MHIEVHSFKARLLSKLGMVVLFALASNFSVLAAEKDQDILRISVAKSFSETGLLDALIKRFKVQNPHINIEVYSVGSLQALEYARSAKVNIVISHYPIEEKRLIADGHALKRTQIMFSKYAVFGPPGDKLGLAQKNNITEVLQTIAEAEPPFIVPSPKGGTYRKIEELWALAGINPEWPDYEYSTLTSPAALKHAAQFQTYTISDMGTFFSNKNTLAGKIVPIYQNDLALQNLYSVLIIKPQGNRTNTSTQYGRKFYEYLISNEGQDDIHQISKMIFNAAIVVPAASLDVELMASRKEKKLEKEKHSLFIINVLLILLLAVVLFLYYLSSKIQKERKIVQEQLKKSYDELEIRVEERTVELTQEVLERKKAEKKAEDANSAKSIFIAKVSHELRTPMQVMMSYSNMGMSKIDVISKEQIFKFFSRINEGGQRLMMSLNELLDLSKLEAGKMIFNMEQHDFGAVIDLAVRELNVLAVNKSLELTVIHSAEKVESNFDIDKILQVIRNLLSNAIKFTPDRKSITLSYEKTGSDIRFTISDQGAGIPEDELNLVFDKFVQSSHSKSVSGGTGLGLAICKEIIKGHGGSIYAANNSQGGADFTFVIPL